MQLSTDSSFSMIIVENPGILDTMIEVGPLDSATTYFWRVRAREGLIAGSWSETWTFRTIIGTLPVPVFLHMPEDGSVISAGSVVCHWHPGFPGVDTYWFEWASDSLFTDSRIDSTGLDTLSVAAPLVNGKTYWWKVRAHNSYGWGPFSEVWQFRRVLIAGIDPGENIPTEYSLSQNFPNPFNPSTVIKYGLPAQSHVVLEVFDIMGQRVALLVNEMQDPGFHEVQFEREGLASGLYLYRIKAGNFTETKKLILLR
jgi:hypothetical protein